MGSTFVSKTGGPTDPILLAEHARTVSDKTPPSAATSLGAMSCALAMEGALYSTGRPPGKFVPVSAKYESYRIWAMYTGL